MLKAHINLSRFPKRSIFIAFILIVCFAIAACSKKEKKEIDKVYIEKDRKTDSDKHDEPKELVDLNESSKDNSNNAMNSDSNTLDSNTLDFYIDIEDTEKSKEVFVAREGVAMRKDPSLNSSIIRLLGNDTKVDIIDIEGEWTKVNYEGEIGYIRSNLLSDRLLEENLSEESTTELSYSSDLITNPKVVVKKSDRILQLWDGDVLYGSYPIGLGWEPVGHKQKEGDGRTPEGIYYVCTRNIYSRFYLSLGVSYPNKEDGKEALDLGLIDQTTYEQIVDAIDKKAQPPWYTAMGGEIMIHGHGSHSDWTAGCVAVENDIMDILWDSCPIGTPIHIEP